jgi:hypothetical protein
MYLKMTTYSYKSPCGASIGGPFQSSSLIPASFANLEAASFQPRFWKSEETEIRLKVQRVSEKKEQKLTRM